MKSNLVCLVLLGFLLAACASQPPALDDLKEWDLVWVSDSTGFGAPDVLGAAIAQERGVKVKVHDVTVGALSLERVLNGLRGGDEGHAALSRLPELLPQAEVVVVLLNPLVNGQHPMGYCVDAAPLTVPCAAEDYAAYRANLEDFFKEVFRLRAGAPTIVRTYEIWLRPAWWKEDNSLAECMQCVGLFNSAVAEVSAKYHIPTARVTDVFNGPAHHEDPQDKGFIGPDGIHASPAGAKALAEAIRALGYAPVKP